MEHAHRPRTDCARQNFTRCCAAVAGRIRNGGDPAEALNEARRALTSAGFAVDYFEVRNAETLAPVENFFGEPVRLLLLAAKLGKTRLIDNIAV